MKLSQPRVLLIVILLLYLLLGVLYAAYTPAWQAPDEPAHYNYIRYLTQNRSFPVLHMGDYPHGYLEQIKAARFPASMSIDSIRYEFHQPPLYYALAVPLFDLTGGALLPLRIGSVLLGLALIVLAFLITRRIFPAWPTLALGAAAFVAFLPRHLASVAQVGNDTLAEVLFALVLWLLTGWLVEVPAAISVSAEAEAGLTSGKARKILLLGILLGLIAITKTTAYFALVLILGVMVWDWRRSRAGIASIVGDLALLTVPAILLAVPWYVRDISVYGWPDFLGLRMHDLIVTGQLRTADYLAQHGLGPYVQELVIKTFESFWAVFGWMGVYVDERMYQALAVLCTAVAAGLLLHEPRVRRAGSLLHGQRYALRMLAVSALLSLLVYAWYNYQFVQFQGRYLFTALIPVAIAFGLGWDEVLHPPSARLIAGFLLLLAFSLALFGLLIGHTIPKWPIALLAVGAAGLALRPLLPRRYDPWLWALPYAVLPLLSLYALFGAIVPQLR